MAYSKCGSSMSTSGIRQVAGDGSPPSISIKLGLMTGDQGLFCVTLVLDKHTLVAACHQLDVSDTATDSDSVMLECTADNQQGSAGRVFDICSLSRHFDDRTPVSSKQSNHNMTLIVALTLTSGLVLLGVLVGLKIKWIRDKLTCNCKKLVRTGTGGAPAAAENTTSSEICLITSEEQCDVI